MSELPTTPRYFLISEEALNLIFETAASAALSQGHGPKERLSASMLGTMELLGIIHEVEIRQIAESELNELLTSPVPTPDREDLN